MTLLSLLVDSITAAVRVVCEELVKGHEEGTKINIWFTGHSVSRTTEALDVLYTGHLNVPNKAWD